MFELCMVYIIGQQVIVGQDNVVFEIVLFLWNVVLVKVVIVDVGGLDINGIYMMKLINVFMIFNWEGGLYFNKNNFIVSVEFMIGIFIIYNNIVMVGYQYSDMFWFIVLVYKGIDYLNVFLIDIIISYFKLSVDLVSEGGICFEKMDVVIFWVL